MFDEVGCLAYPPALLCNNSTITRCHTILSNATAPILFFPNAHHDDDNDDSLPIVCSPRDAELRPSPSIRSSGGGLGGGTLLELFQKAAKSTANVG